MLADFISQSQEVISVTDTEDSVSATSSGAQPAISVSSNTALNSVKLIVLTVAEFVQPKALVTVRVTGNSPNVSKECVGFCSSEVFPSPKSQLQAVALEEMAEKFTTWGKTHPILLSFAYQTSG